MEDIKDKLLKLAKENVNKKMEEEQKRIEKQIKKEEQYVKFILELIEKNMLYKKIGDWNNPTKYELITEKIFFEDYAKLEPKNSWSKKLQIKGQEYWDSNSYKLEIEVNGEKYFHIGYIINNFENDLKEKRTRIKHITDGLWELEKDFEKLKNQEKNIKGFIEDYNAVNKSLNEE